MILEQLLSLRLGFILAFGYPLLFLLLFVEGALFIGVLIPGSWLVFFAGFVAKITKLDIYIVFLIVFFASFLGDITGFYFGKYCGKDFLHKYGRYFLIKREYIDKSGELFCNHTHKSLLFSKFNPLTRSAAPFIFGAHKIRTIKFVFASFLSSFLWTFVFVGAGYLFGQSYSVAEEFERYIFYGIILIILVLYLIYLIRDLRRTNGASCKKQRKKVH